MIKSFPHVITGLGAVADAFAGTVYSDIISMKQNKSLMFIVHKAVGATGTATITIEGADDNTGTNPEAIPFKYQEILSGDTHGALKQATASGFATTAGSNQNYLIFVDAADLGLVSKKWVRLKSVEVVDSPIQGAILAIANDHDYDQEIQDSKL